MMTMTTTTLSLLLISNAAMLAAAALAIVRLQQQYRRFEAFWNSPTGSALLQSTASDFMASPAADVDPMLEQRLADMQRAIHSLAERHQETPAPPAPTRDNAPVELKLPIENAVRMAQRGASVDDLTRNCGLNIGEAQLMRKLHGKRRSA